MGNRAPCPISAAKIKRYGIDMIGSGPGGRWFKSSRPDHFFRLSNSQRTKIRRTPGPKPCVLFSNSLDASALPPSSIASARLVSRSCRQCSGKVESSINKFHEVSFFAKNDSLCLCHPEDLTRFRIRPQARSIRLIRRQAVECNQCPRHIVGAFIGKKKTDEVAATSRNDAAQISAYFLNTSRWNGSIW